MKTLVSFFCLLGAVFASDVIELTDSTFESGIPKATTLVEFFAPWCGHCKKLAPEYETAATALKKNDPPVPLVKIDCTANQAVCGKYGVSGYPTLKVFSGGDVSSDYNGPRDAAGIVSYMKKAAQPASKNLEDVESFENFLTKMDPVAVAFLAASEAEKFSKIADKLRNDFTFGYTSNAEVAEHAGFSDKIVLYRPKHLANKFEDNSVAMSDSIADVIKGGDTKLKTFLNDNVLGLCGHMDKENEKLFGKPLLTAYYDVDYKRNPKGTHYWRNRVLKVGKEYKDQLSLSIANHEDFARELGDLGVKFEDKPIAVVKDKNDKSYIMDKEFNVKNLKEFIDQYIAGDLEPTVKSEPIPESNDGPVTVVVGKTFDEIVMDESKDVLIEFYAPWCGHCKSLAPKWEELGEKMQGDDNIVIAKIDATANYSPSQFAVSGFPTIYWAPKGNKANPVKYSGGREVEDFVKYLEEHSTEKLKKTEL